MPDHILLLSAMPHHFTVVQDDTPRPEHSSILLKYRTESDLFDKEYSRLSTARQTSRRISIRIREGSSQYS